MEMLSNGYGCIKKRSKTLKQSLFDWILHKFNSLLIRTMSEIPTASTSTASTSSASTSQSSPFLFRLAHQDIDNSTTDDSSESSSEVSTESSFDEDSSDTSTISSTSDESDDNMDDRSWSSASSTTVSCDDKLGSNNSDSEKTILKEMIKESLSNKSLGNDLNQDSTSLLVFQVQVHGFGVDLINVEEHTKRLKELEKELDFIESTEWMYRPIDSCIR
ncbi:dentin sialophosphoprotein isoform X2 [Sipha flava]|uniref:Dentin sialophosphoprotein isoform X2 n=1 Tax=Sipha flava TaxID=143950 RepID=A0A2S2R7Q2_9HEMI|nr:dentin sialophosphoprotein isoform X2 [Sipha flava]